MYFTLHELRSSIYERFIQSVFVTQLGVVAVSKVLCPSEWPVEDPLEEPPASVPGPRAASTGST